eukprot:CAMPEP_0206010594 /NCGR_PEP_ID=MMETSP1464-20131121/11916_1 /ASSEMBLY_ACC=CAM_ASM_001124 /TAXON_ID=119497 /ORGANISM="Exanthemachrysis gayraliae, Strain RCC1523" /LENGTH=282 /DNA_ID=CAMNT_0053384221 /DNA_START=352 /DNA_END=1197 /DNA_ORIENTATION=+
MVRQCLRTVGSPRTLSPSTNVARLAGRERSLAAARERAHHVEHGLEGSLDLAEQPRGLHRLEEPVWLDQPVEVPLERRELGDRLVRVAEGVGAPPIPQRGEGVESESMCAPSEHSPVGPVAEDDGARGPRALAAIDAITRRQAEDVLPREERVLLLQALHPPLHALEDRHERPNLVHGHGAELRKRAADALDALPRGAHQRVGAAHVVAGRRVHEDAQPAVAQHVGLVASNAYCRTAPRGAAVQRVVRRGLGRYGGSSHAAGHVEAGAERHDEGCDGHHNDR